MVQIPIVDFEGFNADDNNVRARIANDIHRAASEVGFMYAKNVTVDPTLIAEAYKSSADFFALPQEIKEACYYRSEINFGYQAVGGQRLDQTISPDLKEAMTMRNVPGNSGRTELWP